MIYYNIIIYTLFTNLKLCLYRTQKQNKATIKQTKYLSRLNCNKILYKNSYRLRCDDLSSFNISGS